MRSMEVDSMKARKARRMPAIKGRKLTQEQALAAAVVGLLAALVVSGVMSFGLTSCIAMVTEAMR